MCTGKIKKAAREDSIFRKDFSMADLDMLQINIRLDQSSVSDMHFEWAYEVPLLLLT
jgi:hypothetical protein